MDSDTPSPQNRGPQNPIPQDPARFSKPKSEPPILDLEAEKPVADDTAGATQAPQGSDRETVDRATPDHDLLRVTKPVSQRGPKAGLWTGFAGGLIGGGCVALGFLGYAHFSDPTASRLAALELTIAQKPDQDAIAAFDLRLNAIDAAQAGMRSMLASNAKQAPTPDPELAKRIAKLEESLRLVATQTPQDRITPDPQALRLALVLSMRDAVRNDQFPVREIAALDHIGEASAAFKSLKASLASPLLSFDEIRLDMMPLVKSATAVENVNTDPGAPASRISSFWSQWISVRPVSSEPPKAMATGVPFAPLMDAIDQNDARAALTALSTLPEAEREKWRRIESEIQRRVTSETAIAELLDEALDAVAKGIAP